MSATDVTIANIIIGHAHLVVDGTSVGALSGGVAISKATDVYEVFVDQIRAPVIVKPTKETFTVKTNLAEATLANLRLVWNIPSSKLTQGGLYLKMGLSTGVYEHTLQVTGVAPNGRTRVYTCFLAVSISASEHSYQENKETLIPVSFTILPDTTKAVAEELGEILDY